MSVYSRESPDKLLDDIKACFLHTRSSNYLSNPVRSRHHPNA